MRAKRPANCMELLDFVQLLQHILHAQHARGNDLSHNLRLLDVAPRLAQRLEDELDRPAFARVNCDVELRLSLVDTQIAGFLKGLL